jgi:hypothetical protein
MFYAYVIVKIANLTIRFQSLSNRFIAVKYAKNLHEKTLNNSLALHLNIVLF